MNRLPPCLLYSEDDEWAGRVARSLQPAAAVRPGRARAQLESILERNCAAVLLLDVRGESTLELLARIVATWPPTVVLAFGEPGSDPLREAEALGVYAVESLLADHRRLQAVVARALEYLQLRVENRLLRDEAERIARRGSAARPAPAGEPSGALAARRFPSAARHVDNVEALLESLAEVVADAVLVTRVGLFCRSRDSDQFRLRAGIRCLADTGELTYEPADALVRWLERHVHMVFRPHLEHIEDPATRLLLRQTLDVLGAEVLVPLQARERLLGWLFVGHRATGLPFEQAHLEQLNTVADHVSTTLENALLYEELTIQKTLAETLLQTLPTGIVAVDAAGIVRWYSAAAQAILDLPVAAVLHQPVEKLGSRIADIVRRSLLGEAAVTPAPLWTDPVSQRTMAVQGLQLADRELCLGAVALIQDLTAQQAFKEKQEQMERAVFWTELAAGMSHEIRNPLVAIKTFAQLLPERYNDAEFRDEFSQNVTREVDRLNSIITQIHEFAHPPQLKFEAVDLRSTLNQSVETVFPAAQRHDLVVELHLDPHLPPVWGDRRARTESFVFMLTNAREALAQRAGARVVIRACVVPGAPGAPANPQLEIAFADNGPGIPSEIADRVFSPFCTTKARGLGLGLPIVKRTVVDHNGQVRIDPSGKGTVVTITLPQAPEGAAQPAADPAAADPSGQGVTAA
ncbi:MAG: ATP-binding protein [Kiritimatiellaeota bacterium]|nr:ATP-binding protein [Kiritimatiellota bacterium]